MQCQSLHCFERGKPQSNALLFLIGILCLFSRMLNISLNGWFIQATLLTQGFKWVSNYNYSTIVAQVAKAISFIHEEISQAADLLTNLHNKLLSCNWQEVCSLCGLLQVVLTTCYLSASHQVALTT